MTKELFYEKHAKHLRETFESFVIKRLRLVFGLRNKVRDETLRNLSKRKR